ncbi:MarR family winged helix-turn-helix transcriptional regulator [Tumebacillus permanentifrigoris]|uniref:MarR family transcriptional regulator n=1 Tax=Tumebacillus permanentifrigoris TaxID=378543 RepID=A0A316E134_9BACL|nr:MarR family transcriptional regulator [Tumebacillus permanentifrigoris]PWK16520.1 MarR family transcriptional regulator [Tumebacillus permanentifrigoris]
MKSNFNEAEESPGFMLWQVTTTWQKAMRTALEPFDLTHPQFVLLFSAKWLNERNDHAGITQVQLAQHVKIDVNVTSQVLRTLEKKGYIQRSPHPTDSRANVISVTASGDEIASRAVQAVEERDRAFFSVLGDEVGDLNRLLQILIKG